jgi:hypothetical protein
MLIFRLCTTHLRFTFFSSSGLLWSPASRGLGFWAARFTRRK